MRVAGSFGRASSAGSSSRPPRRIAGARPSRRCVMCASPSHRRAVATRTARAEGPLRVQRSPRGRRGCPPAYPPRPCGPYRAPLAPCAAPAPLATPPRARRPRQTRAPPRASRIPSIGARSTPRCALRAHSERRRCPRSGRLCALPAEPSAESRLESRLCRSAARPVLQSSPSVRSRLRANGWPEVLRELDCARSRQ